MIEDVGTQDRGWGWHNIAALLPEPYRSRLSLPQKIALLRCCCQRRRQRERPVQLG